MSAFISQTISLTQFYINILSQEQPNNTEMHHMQLHGGSKYSSWSYFLYIYIHMYVYKSCQSRNLPMKCLSQIILGTCWNPTFRNANLTLNYSSTHGFGLTYTLYMHLQFSWFYSSAEIKRTNWLGQFRSNCVLKL